MYFLHFYFFYFFMTEWERKGCRNLTRVTEIRTEPTRYPLYPLSHRGAGRRLPTRLLSDRVLQHPLAE